MKCLKTLRNRWRACWRIGHAGRVPLPGGTVDQAVLDDLRREMMEAADALEFERAAYLRDQIKALKAIK